MWLRPELHHSGVLQRESFGGTSLTSFLQLNGDQGLQEDNPLVIAFLTPVYNILIPQFSTVLGWSSSSMH